MERQLLEAYKAENWAILSRNGIYLSSSTTKSRTTLLESSFDIPNE